MADVPTTSAGPAAQSSSTFVNRYPNFFYHTIAAICVILVVVEVVGFLKGDGVKIAILFGLAILALLAPNIESLKISKSGIVADLKKRIDENSNKIDHTKSATRESDAQLDQKITQIFEELRGLRTTALSMASVAKVAEADTERRAKPLELRPVSDPTDPQKGRFCGEEERNGRRLSALVVASSIRPDWCQVTLKVTSLRGSPTLTGNVGFYLHDTFRPDHYSVQAIKGEASLVLSAWGAFTVGAIADEGKTMLELDLATSQNVIAPARWRKR